MTKFLNAKKSLVALACLSAVTLVGCGGSSTTTPLDSPEVSAPVSTPTPVATPGTAEGSYEYEITLTNVTSNQPLSPITLLTHAEDDSLFDVGVEASVALEVLAEAGDNSDILALSTNVNTVADSAPLGPGGTYTGRLVTADTSLNLTILSMLVNTNDAITGLNNTDLADYEVNEKKTFSLSVYDSGTEANTETAATIPGPAGVGADGGFDSARDDIINVVTMHAGVISNQDGLADSALDASYRFDNVVAKVTITRLK